jgi:hypothetical protein
MENMEHAINVTRTLKLKRILENDLNKKVWQKGVNKINKSQNISQCWDILNMEIKLCGLLKTW